MEQMKENDEPFNFGLNHHHIVSSSSSSAPSCHIFFNPTQDHAAFYHPQLYHHHPHDDYYGRGYEGGRSSYEMEKKAENGLKLTLWKKEDERPAQNILVEDDHDGVIKWKKKKKKKKKTKKKREDEEVKARCSSSDLSSLSLSYNCSNTPIRVCSDCHTTKTPLWRSGPKGPKSLCNACGIRQRKARRALAAAAAANGGGGGAAAASSNPMKVKEKMKKRSCKVSGGGGGGSSSTKSKKNKNNIGNFEELLINLRKKLALIQRVFPQDEKEAAILLMALSSGLLHA